MPRVHLLIVCTANVCRSPVVEHLFRRALTSHGLDVDVTSAGTHGGQNVVHRNTVIAAGEIGVDLSQHVSRHLDGDLIENDGADLVVTMTREHLLRVVELVPDAFDRTFTLPELALLSKRHGVDPLTRDVGSWRRAISMGRQRADVIDGGEAYDVEDPYGGPRGAHRRMVKQVDELVSQIVPVLAASVDPPD